MGTPAACRRWPNAPTSGGRSRWIVCTPKARASVRPTGSPLLAASHPGRVRTGAAAHELIEAGRADDLLVLAVLQDRPEGPIDRLDVQALDAEQAQGRQPVDRLGDPGRLLHVG